MKKRDLIYSYALILMLLTQVRAAILGSVTAKGVTYSVQDDTRGDGLVAKFGVDDDTRAIYVSPKQDGANAFLNSGKWYKGGDAVANQPHGSYIKINAKAGSFFVPIVAITPPATVPATVPAVVTPATLPVVIDSSPTTKPIPPPPVVDVPATQANRPSIASTGPKAGLSLKSAVGVKFVGGEYNGYLINGGAKAILKAGEVIAFRNCKIDGGLYGINCHSNLGLVIIDHCEIINSTDAAVYGENFQATGNYIHRSGGDGFKPGSNSVIHSNYVTELGWMSGSAHADGVQIRSGENIRIIGNFFDMPNNVTNTRSNSSMELSGATKNVAFTGNWCNGGNHTVHAVADNAADDATIQIAKNVFFSGSPKFAFGDIAAGVSWTGNLTDKGNPAKPGDK